MIDINDVVVVLNTGPMWVLLPTWMREGPGGRYAVRPRKVLHAPTQTMLPFRTIPLAYQNNYRAIKAILAGTIPDPWNRDRHRLRVCLDILDERYADARTLYQQPDFLAELAELRHQRHAQRYHARYYL